MFHPLEAHQFDWLMLLNPGIVWLLVPIVGILAAVGFQVIRRLVEHRERMAMIERGIHPDYPLQDEPSPDVASVPTDRTRPPPCG